MKEHKNPKVLSEGLLWMHSAVEDFGVAHLKLKDVIDFCKDTGLQSSAAATRNATIKLIGALHKYVGPDIKGFLSDVKPALLSAVEAECEKNPFEVWSSSRCFSFLVFVFAFWALLISFFSCRVQRLHQKRLLKQLMQHLLRRVVVWIACHVRILVER